MPASALPPATSRSSRCHVRPVSGLRQLRHRAAAPPSIRFPGTAAPARERAWTGRGAIVQGCGEMSFWRSEQASIAGAFVQRRLALRRHRGEAGRLCLGGGGNGRRRRMRQRCALRVGPCDPRDGGCSPGRRGVGGPCMNSADASSRALAVCAGNAFADATRPSAAARPPPSRAARKDRRSMGAPLILNSALNRRAPVLGIQAPTPAAAPNYPPKQTPTSPDRTLVTTRPIIARNDGGDDDGVADLSRQDRPGRRHGLSQTMSYA